MPTTYDITAPDGEVYEVTGEGTEQEALAQFQQQWKANGGAAQPQPKGFLEDPAGYLSASYNNMTDLDQWKHALTESPEAKSVMNPGQSIPDLARSMGNFTSLGATDRLRSMMYGTNVADEVAQTQQGSERLGSIDEAANLGTAFVQPSMAAKALPAGAGMVRSALTHGAEQAGLSGAQAAFEGRDVLPAMGVGGAFGGGGSIAADSVGSVANIFSKKAKPQYINDDALQDAAKTASQKLNTKAGRKAGDDVISRNALMDQVRLAETKGPQAFGQLSERLEGAGRDPRFPREVYEGISKLGTASTSPIRRGIANVLDFGGGFGKLAATMKTGGVAPLASAILKTSADLGGNLDSKTLAKVKAQLLQGSGTPGNPAMTPEMREELRNYLAKMGGGAARAP